MEEESIDHDLEERMYAALHYVDGTQPEITNQKETPNFDNTQQSTYRRYWRANRDVTRYSKVNTSCNKINTPSNVVNTVNKNETDKSEPKSNEIPTLNSVAELSLFQQPVPKNVKKTIEILETEVKNCVVELESSDEDEVVEVTLPPKPTITIESSDDEDNRVSTKSTKENVAIDVKPNNDQDRTSSPVPSTVSSISDEFIRSDCIALNISSRHPDQSTLGYSLQGSDLEQTPSKKRKNRKSIDATSTPISSKSIEIDECFATPKSKAKNKKPKTKSYQVSNISIPSADVYDSDSNQSIVESNKSANYKVTDRSLSNTIDVDVYETDSNQSERIKDNPIKSTEIMVSAADSSVHLSEGKSQVLAVPNTIPDRERQKSVIDLTEKDSIQASLVMRNVTEFSDSLQGTNINETPSRKRKKKKNRNKKGKDATSTPISSKSTEINECFATSKSQAKNKKQKTKSYQVSNISIPSADVYDSDSNQSIVESNKSTAYIVTDRSLSNTIDIYETDSNQSEQIKDSPIKSTEIMVRAAESAEHISEGKSQVSDVKNTIPERERRKNVIDLTEMVSIEESIVMANVTGFSDQEDNIDENFITKNCPSKCGSTKIPAILYENLDFDNLKGNKVCKKRRYSLTALRAEMEKFYNESWGGEDFNHREIQKNMSRDKSLWAIDPKDRMPVLAKRKTMCGLCKQGGHRDDTCRFRTPICHMCGSAGHYEPRCPKKICVNCGLPNHIYTTMCRNCSTWKSIKCAECGQNGHPSSHCPDIWRRYHNTISLDVPLEENRQVKKYFQTCCSGCTRRGHLVHNCRQIIPFSELPIFSPYVVLYRPVYSSTINENPTHNTEPNNKKNKQQKKNNQDTNTPKSDRNKRQSKSPIANEFMNKKRNLGSSNEPNNCPNSQHKKHSHSKDNKSDSNIETNKNTNKLSEKKDTLTENTADLIAVSSSNHDEKGQIIQDNEVSDTSEVSTSARIYITNEICQSLKTTDGVEWLKQVSTKNNITVENTDYSFYISIKGSVGNQEAFQSELRDWIKGKQPTKEHRNSESDANSSVDINTQPLLCDNIPKNRNMALRTLGKALYSLKTDIGDPKALYKELTYLQNRRKQLMTQHDVNPEQLSNNSSGIMVILKKLNMVLLGQAGLADGSKHLSKLWLLYEKITNLRCKIISVPLREEVGEHFRCIFTAAARDDYVELLNKYYNKTPVQAVGKNSKKKLLKRSPNMIQSNKVNRKFSPKKIAVTTGQKDNSGQLTPSILYNRLKKAKNSIMFVHFRLTKTKPVTSSLKKARRGMMTKLHDCIASFSNISKLSQNDLMKAEKVEKQAKRLLINLELAY